jgi:hypothetical protein
MDAGKVRMREVIVRTMAMMADYVSERLPFPAIVYQSMLSHANFHNETIEAFVRCRSRVDSPLHGEPAALVHHDWRCKYIISL